jgi:hypothetical protein
LGFVRLLCLSAVRLALSDVIAFRLSPWTLAPIVGAFTLLLSAIARRLFWRLVGLRDSLSLCLLAFLSLRLTL